MARVYRLEGFQGGLYLGSYADSLKGFNQCECHKLPSEDELMSDKWDGLEMAKECEPYYFGFSDLRQLFRWVPRHDWQQSLDKQGCCICIYECPDECILVGETQVAFIKDNAMLLEITSFAMVFRERMKLVS